MAMINLEEENLKVKVALDLAYEYAQIDGAHHKAWVLDQMVRALHGDENKYKKWVREFEDGEDGPHTYEWDTGIAP
jgi:hypothetical protein